MALDLLRNRYESLKVSEKARKGTCEHVYKAFILDEQCRQLNTERDALRECLSKLKAKNKSKGQRMPKGLENAIKSIKTELSSIEIRFTQMKEVRDDLLAQIDNIVHERHHNQPLHTLRRLYLNYTLGSSVYDKKLFISAFMYHFFSKGFTIVQIPAFIQKKRKDKALFIPTNGKSLTTNAIDSVLPVVDELHPSGPPWHFCTLGTNFSLSFETSDLIECISITNSDQSYHLMESIFLDFIRDKGVVSKYTPHASEMSPFAFIQTNYIVRLDSFEFTAEITNCSTFVSPKLPPHLRKQLKSNLTTISLKILL